MGAGCSSPLKRFGGKRGKQRQASSPMLERKDNHNHKDQARRSSATDQLQHQQQHQQAQQYKTLALENEITIQSEGGEDHPSTASYYTEGKNHNEDTKISGQSGGLDPNPAASTNRTPNIGQSAAAVLAARMMGLTGSYTPHDRHLLVSPALSPAPSTCYSPSPACGTANSAFIDLQDLNEAFKTITFGSQQDITTTTQQQQNSTKRIVLAQRHPPQTELHNNYNHQLVQTKQDLINYISVIFITTDTFQYFTPPPASTITSDHDTSNHNIDALANHIESNLKSFCDEHLFNLRFLNLSHEHLSQHFHINNLLDASMTTLETEFIENSQRMIIVILSNNLNGTSETLATTAMPTTTTISSDKRQLPTRIEAQAMNKIQTLTNSDEQVQELLRRWYNQVGGTFYLKPIYLVYPNILNHLKEERDQAWQNWLNESRIILEAFQATDLPSGIKLKSLFSSYLDFIMKEPTLQKRTLLIRNYLSSNNGNLNLSNQQQTFGTNQINRDGGNLNELARILADPNKLNLKRAMSDDDFIKTVSDWTIENFNKFVEGILENQVVYGKHVPPFVDRNLFYELTSQRHQLEHFLVDVTENYELKCGNFYQNQILPILNNITSLNGTSNDLASNLQDTRSEEHLPIEISSNHLVFISGPKGCGKSSLFAQIIKLTAQDLHNKAQIIYRFCGISLDSSNSNRLLRSICEQFCQTQGENITAASYIYSARKEIMNALNKIIQSQPSIIFLDGLDKFKSCNLESDLEWICEINSNTNVKIFIMLETNSDFYKKVLGSYSDATHISLDKPSIGEWAQMLTCTARSRRFNSLGNLYDEIKNLNMKTDTEEECLTYSDVSDIIHMCRIRKLNNESIYPELSSRMIQNNLVENYKGIQQVIITHLQYLITPYQLCTLFIILDSSRYGMTESDIISIMSLLDSQSPSGRSTKQSAEVKFSYALLNYLKIQLEPWLIYVLNGTTIKITLKRSFLTRAIEKYVSTMYPNIVTEVREMLLDYFSRQRKPKTSKSSSKGEASAIEPRESVSRFEKAWLATQASEVMNLLLLSNVPKAREYIMNKNQFFLQFLYGSMPEEFIEDYQNSKDVLGKKSLYNDELQHLVKYIQHSIYPLRYDGAQIYSQIYCRAYEAIKTGKLLKSKKFNDILNLATCPPTSQLLPISETSIDSFIRTRIGQLDQGPTASPSSTNLNATINNNNNSNVQKQPTARPTSNSQPPTMALARQRIYTIKNNHRHVIVVYPDKGCLLVWDIYEEKAVRTINNLDQPRDLRMIDQKRAVVLCNRELRVYDLDTGDMLTKLKGVMNQKMPFFEVFEENYVVALARNRMYVNMLNLNTGELETTFKVGEDRFLNSLLVSANGGICVCGDETQKPFPLLVWNLNERRLMYDLRLDRHEFITRMSAISDEGHFVVSVCKQLGENGDASVQTNSNSTNSSRKASSSPNFIVIYDLNSGTLFKKWKPGLDSCAVAISIAANRSGKVLNAMVDSSILVWDLATSSKRHTLIGHSAPPDVIKVQNNRLFSMDSTCQDQSLRIWDIEEGYCLAVFSSDAPVNCCQMSIRGDALVCGFAAETRLSTMVLCKNETVNDVVKRNKRRKSSKSLYIFDEPPSRKSSQ